jgi:Na+-driven multidrug efflux pump
MSQEERVSFNKEYWRFLWSSILIALSGCLGNVVDGIIVGNLIGEDGVSAINISRTVIQFMFTLSMLLSTGAGMLVGIELGKRDTARAAYIYTVSMAACLAVGLLLTVTGLTVPGTVAGWLCKEELLFQPTLDYLIPMLLGAPAYMMVWAMGTMVGVDGSPRLVSLAIMVDNTLNLCLDIVFIQWLGWGIAGSSVATVVGHLVGVAIMCLHWRGNEESAAAGPTGARLRLVRLWPSTKAAKAVADSSFFILHSSFRKIISQGAPLAVASICLTLLLYSANTIVLSSVGRAGIFAFAVCMNLLQIYNLFLAGVCRTIQSLGAIQVGKGDNEAFRLVLRKSFGFITAAMIVTCLFVWTDPEAVTKFFGASEADMIAEGSRALRIFALSFIPFCYIYALMIVYKLYGHHHMALFISFALSLTVIPVLWIVSRVDASLLWYSYLIAYALEIMAIVTIHKLTHARFELKKR